MALVEPSGDITAPVAVALLLDDGGSRRFEASPSRISFGALQMRSWQIFPTPVSAEFAGHDAYLIKIHYDLMLEPGVPPLPWFEIGFDLSETDAHGAAFIDAIPAGVLEAQQPTSFALSSRLTFVPGDGVDLPAVQPIVDVFGRAGTQLRWRHSAETGVRPGNYTCWTSVVVPAGCRQLIIDVGARFDLGVDSEYARIYEPAYEPARVVLALQESTAPSVAPQQDSGSAPAKPAPAVPRVFISYTHDTHDHAMAVLKFSEFLATECGLDVHMDRWDLDVRRNWFRWAIDQITSADFVIVIASPNCKATADGHVDSETNRGMQSELSILMDRLHDDREIWIRKLLPVVLAGRTVGEIPLFLQPGIADYYLVPELTIAGAEDLLRVITGQAPYSRPQRNPTVPVLPTRRVGP